MLPKSDFPLKPYSHKELADYYGVSWPTFQNWIKPHLETIGKKIGHLYTVRQVEIILELFGTPSKLRR